MKCRVPGVTACYPFQSSQLQSSCSKFSISAVDGSTAGTKFFESHVEYPITVFEFQGHSGNSAFIAVISFLQTRRNHRGPHQANKKGGGPQPYF
jgi:hypothetical protein